VRLSLRPSQNEHYERIYSVQGVLAAYLDAEPDDISISGTLAETGVDETAVITFKYSDGRVGVASCNARAQLHNEGEFRDPRISLVLVLLELTNTSL